MRVALISDTHANATALEAVLAHLEQDPVDHLICLGDVAATGPDPVATLERVRGLGCPVVLGNKDEALLNGGTDQGWTGELDRWCFDQLDDEHRAFVETFRSTVALDLAEDVRLLAYHGTPRSNTEALFPETPREELAGLLADQPGTVWAGGHTHIQMVRKLRDRLIVNPGSVGLPLEPQPGTGLVHQAGYAEYGVVEADGPRELSATLHRVPVSLDALRAGVERSGMPHGQRWLGAWGVDT